MASLATPTVRPRPHARGPAAALLLLASAGCDSIDPLQLNSASAPVRPGARVDHAPYDALLRTFVAADGDVDYRGLASQQAALLSYLEQYAEADPAPLSRADRLAYWINAYNAITLAGIVHHYPTASIRDLSGFWTRILTNCGGRLVSLDDIEHRILRPMGEPRIHVAINCASRSCPKLLDRAYTGAALESQLDLAARAFLADPERNRFDSATRTAHLSKIFSWFGEDLEGAPYGSVRGFVRRYGPALPWLADDFAVRHLAYDWSLNEQRQ